MVQRRPTTPLGRTLRALSLITLAYLTACGTSDAVAQDYDGLDSNVDQEVELTFSDIEVEDRSQRLEVEYRLQDADWRWARDNEYDLWLTLYAPSGDDYVFVHGMPLQTYRGRVLFPSHVRYYEHPYIGLCVVAVGVGEAFDPGYGYVCEDPVRVTVRKRRAVRWNDSRVRFTLGFHYGIYNYSWFHPHYGFYYPSYYYGPYPPRAIIYYGRHRHYHPRHHRRVHRPRGKHHRDKFDRGRHRDTRRDFDRRGRRDTVERRRRTPTRQRVEPRRVEPRRVEPRRVEPQQVTPPQIDPKPRQIRVPSRQVRPEQIQPQQRRIQPHHQQVRPQKQRIRGKRPATRPRQPTRGKRPPTRRR